MDTALDGGIPASPQSEEVRDDIVARTAKQRRGSIALCARCQVEGCGKDLSSEKMYNIRHRVCAEHLKSLQVSIHGVSSRFCQQCARFHRVEEFDGAKRSCRQRLLQHNARRRKGEKGMDGEEFGRAARGSMDLSVCSGSNEMLPAYMGEAPNSNSSQQINPLQLSVPLQPLAHSQSLAFGENRWHSAAARLPAAAQAQQAFPSQDFFSGELKLHLGNAAQPGEDCSSDVAYEPRNAYGGMGMRMGIGHASQDVAGWADGALRMALQQSAASAPLPRPHAHSTGLFGQGNASIGNPHQVASELATAFGASAQLPFATNPQQQAPWPVAVPSMLPMPVPAAPTPVAPVTAPLAHHSVIAASEPLLQPAHPPAERSIMDVLQGGGGGGGGGDGSSSSSALFPQPGQRGFMLQLSMSNTSHLQPRHASNASELAISFENGVMVLGGGDDMDVDALFANVERQGPDSGSSLTSAMSNGMASTHSMQQQQGAAAAAPSSSPGGQQQQQRSSRSGRSSGGRRHSTAGRSSAPAFTAGGMTANQVDDAMLRISMRLASCRPEHLPPDLYARLKGLISNINQEQLTALLDGGGNV